MSKLTDKLEDSFESLKRKAKISSIWPNGPWWKYLPGGEFVPYLGSGIEEDRNKGVSDKEMVKNKFPKYLGRLFIKGALWSAFSISLFESFPEINYSQYSGKGSKKEPVDTISYKSESIDPYYGLKQDTFRKPYKVFQERCK